MSNNALIAICLLKNCLCILGCIGLAIYFNNWLLVLLSILFTSEVSFKKIHSKEDDKNA